MEQRIVEIRRYVDELKVSHNWIAEEVFRGTVSRSYISKLLNGKLMDLSEDSLTGMVEVLEQWVESEQSRIDILYGTLRGHLREYPNSIQKIALKRLLGDLV